MRFFKKIPTAKIHLAQFAETDLNDVFPDRKIIYIYCTFELD